MSDPGLGTQRVPRKGETWQLEAWPRSVLRKGGRGWGGALHRRLTLSDTPALLNRRPSAALRSVGSQRPQRGQTRFANSRAQARQEGAAGVARGLRLRGLDLRAAAWAGTERGGQKAPSISQRRAPRPPESGSRACTRTHAARERARQITRPTDGGRGGGGGGAHRLRGKHDHVTAAPPPPPPPPQPPEPG